MEDESIEERKRKIADLYRPLVGKTFEGTYVDEMSSIASIEPMKRKVIEVAGSPSLVKHLEKIDDNLEGLVWKGVIFHRKDGCYKFYADEDSPIPSEGASGLFRIESFHIFNVTKLSSDYRWKLGVSITLRYEDKSSYF